MSQTELDRNQPRLPSWAWVLLPFSPDWRWMTGRDDTPWYPTARLFRQPAPGDWDAVFAAVLAALRTRS